MNNIRLAFFAMVMVLPIHLFAGTLDFSKFDSSLKSFEYSTKNVESNGGKTNIMYTGVNSNHSFFASDYGYPHNSNTVSGNIWLLDKNDSEIEESTTNYIVDYDSIITIYALAPNQTLQLTDDQFRVLDEDGNQVNLLPKVTFGTKQSRCKYRTNHLIAHGTVTYTFTTCPVSIRAISPSTGAIYELSAQFNNISVESSSTIKSDLYNALDEHIGYIEFNLNTGKFTFLID